LSDQTISKPLGLLEPDFGSQYQQWREKGPSQTHERTLVAAEHVAPRHLQDELALAPEAPAQGRGECGLGGAGVH
jgi:hypothetical protein